MSGGAGDAMSLESAPVDVAVWISMSSIFSPCFRAREESASASATLGEMGRPRAIGSRGGRDCASGPNGWYKGRREEEEVEAQSSVGGREPFDSAVLRENETWEEEDDDCGRLVLALGCSDGDEEEDVRELAMDVWAPLWEDVIRLTSWWEEGER